MYINKLELLKKELGPQVRVALESICASKGWIGLAIQDYKSFDYLMYEI